MGDYLDAYMSSLPDGQKKAILKIIDQEKAAGTIATREQFEVELDKLVRMLSADGYDLKLSLKHPELTEASVISSSMLNENFKSIYVALYGLFTQMNRADATVTKHRNVRKSDFDKVRAATNKLLEDLAIHRFLKTLGSEWNEAKHNTFWNRRNANGSIKAADVDERTKHLRLRVGRSRRLHQFAGTMATQISVESLCVGLDASASKNHKPENALDNDYETFWAHMVLADNPVKSNVDGTEVTGAAVRVTIEFPAVEPVTCLDLVPFGSHPVSISNLEYWTGTAWQAVTISYPDASLDWMSLQFEEAMTNRIRFVLRQENYTKNTYMIPRRLYASALLWEQVLDKELLLGVEEEELTGAQAAAVQVNPGFRALVSAVNRFQERLGKSGLDFGQDSEQELMRTVDAATRVIAETRESDAEIVLKTINGDTSAPELNPDDVIPVTKCEYLLGLRQVSIEYRDYFPIGIYESPEYDTRGSVHEVGLDVDEFHVQLTDPNGVAYQATSIEYEVEVSPERKTPILPSGTTRVYQELLIMDPNTLSGRLRFLPASPPNIQVRRDGILITSWTQYARSIVLTSGYNRGSVYTVDYDPLAGQDVVDLDSLYNSVALVKPELFNNTDDSGMLELSFIPYVAWEVINNESDWVQPDSGHAKFSYRIGAGSVTIDGITYSSTGNRTYEPIKVLVDGIQARNITNYRTGEHQAFADLPGQALVFQYIHSGRKLYFSRPIKGSTIEVHYRWLAQYLKLVATLRGHKLAFNPYTPELWSYRLKLKTARL